MADRSIQLAPVTRAHLREMMAWFPSQRSCIDWGGPDFRYPFDEDTFRVDTKAAELPSYALVGGSGALCGFGQYYLRAARCHLSRLVIAPERRGEGLGAHLIRLLVIEGTRKLGVHECSLFVFAHNAPAMALYERLGFRLAQYPDASFSMPGCLYMVAPSAVLI